MTLPSKGLMSEALGDGIVTKIGDLYGSELFYHSDKAQYPPLPYSINIYEFAHKHCVDWAFNKGYDICPKEIDGKYFLLTDEKILGNKVGNHFVVSDTFSPFENRLEAIFKACEWIMEQTK